MSRELILFPCWSVAYAAGLALLMMGTRSQFQSRHQDCRGTRRLGRHLDRRRIRRDFDLSRIGNQQQRINLARRALPSAGDGQGTCDRMARQTLKAGGVADGEGPFGYPYRWACLFIVLNRAFCSSSSEA
jgi:hypothetical protein